MSLHIASLSTNIAADIDRIIAKKNTVWCKSVENWRRYGLLCIFQDCGRGHLETDIPPFGTTHGVPDAGFYAPCQWRNHELEFVENVEILAFRDSVEKCPLSPILGCFGDSDSL